MRVALFDGRGSPIRIAETPDPKPEPGEVVVKVCRCGICASDVAMTAPDAPIVYQNGPMGHEYAGEVVEIGRDVSAVKVGDRVAGMALVPCGTCDGCRSGNVLFCQNLIQRNMGFGEYALLPQKAAIPLPKTLSLRDAAFVEPMSCGLHGVRLSGLSGGERLLVIGAGAIGLAVTYWARRRGAGKIAVMSRSADRGEMAMQMGADAIVSFEAEDRARIAESLGGPPDIVAECVGKQGMLSLALELVRPQGTVASMSLCMQPDPVTPAICCFKEIRLVFPMAWTVAEFAEAARTLDSGAIPFDAMIGEVIGLDALPATIEALRAGKRSLKIQVDPNMKASHG